MCRYFQHVGRVGKDVQARGVSGETREAWCGIFIRRRESRYQPTPVQKHIHFHTKITFFFI